LTSLSQIVQIIFLMLEICFTLLENKQSEWLIVLSLSLRLVLAHIKKSHL
jgi:hypothetical protein